jgi:hypothetical protein
MVWKPPDDGEGMKRRIGTLWLKPPKCEMFKNPDEEEVNASRKKTTSFFYFLISYFVF